MKATTPEENLRHKYQMSDLSLEENTRSAMLGGTAEQVRRRIQDWIDMRIRGIVLHWPPNEPRELERFAREVIAAFR